MSVQNSSSPFVMSKLFGSEYETWTLDLFDKKDTRGPVHMVYIREFSEDKSEVRIRTFDWKNDECLVKARNLVGNRLLASLQQKKEGIVLTVSEKLKDNFEKGRPIKIVYQGVDSSETICEPIGTAFLTERMFAETTDFFKEFCVTSAKRRQTS